MADQNLGEFISLDEAKTYVSDFKLRNPDAIRSYSVSGEKIQQILAQENCIGLRVYNGYDEVNKHANIVILGIDANYADLDQGLILDKTGFCPPWCGTGVLMQ